MSGMECGEKGCKNQSSPESRNDSDCVQIAADCKKKIGKCDNVNQEKKHVSEIVRVLDIERDAGSASVFAGSTIVIMSIGSTDVFDANNGSTVAFAGSTSVIMFVGSTDVFDMNDGSTVAFAGSTSVIVGNTDGFEVSKSTFVSAPGRTSVFNKSGSIVEFAWITSVFYGIGSNDDSDRSTGVFDTIGRTNVVGSTGSGVMESDKMKKMKKLKQEEFGQGRVLEHGKDAQTPLATVSLGSDEMSLGSNENSDARPCAMRIRRAQI
eukprot:CAMPEP_0201915670 /NCGR_PEP_ID=MMETSP0903-20130614/5524_1 /ASSEMBLY_ACC=CAM_ASM_000552 /TAXON_ID=420261 /ORGANISM="Thalassiosira antarctica, Strain CCMP982" /LENGTH=264 /DNA_ID=CAMNT_0048451331 /DNA_START=392 /DNA_END=1186 /DNA_ORIENTATION=+